VVETVMEEIMDKYNNLSRRDFIKISSATAAAMTLSPNLLDAFYADRYDSKGLPTRILGKTGVEIPLIAIGTGSRYCSVEDNEEALNILTYALDNGLYYWDTAHIYSNGSIISEKRLGEVLKHRREEVFLSTKISTRDPEEAKIHIEKSLKRLQTDHFDILKVHSVEDPGDLKEITKKGGLYEVVRSMKEQGVAKFIGFSGHNSEEAMAKAASDYDFDTMLVALNHYSSDGDNFEENAVSAAKMKNMGIMVMKVIRPRETVEGIDPKDLIRYALSLQSVHGAVVGIDSMEVLKENIELVKSFKPLSPIQMKELKASLSPFYRNKNLEWLRDNYQDGLWA
jgi:predicted aldo/keto reductase-like oxidoreductase